MARLNRSRGAQVGLVVVALAFAAPLAFGWHAAYGYSRYQALLLTPCAVPTELRFLDDEILRPNGRDSTVVKVTHSGTITWRLIGDDYDCRIEALAPEPNQPATEHRARLYVGRRTGELRVLAEDAGDPNCAIEARANVDGGCSSCGGHCGYGKEDVDVRYVHAEFSLGKRDRDAYAGKLRLYSETPSSALAQPGGLAFNLEHPDVDVIRSGSVLRQVMAPQTLADIQTEPNDPTYTYWIRFYAADDIGAFDPNTGLYPVGAATPTVRWKISNPNGVTNNTTLEISKYVDSTLKKVYQYNYTTPSGDTKWELKTGDGMTWARTEEEVWKSAGATRIYCRFQDGGLVQKTRESWTTKNYGKVMTEYVVDPNDIKIITDYAYNDSGAATKGRLKSVNPDFGGWMVRTVNANGQPTSVIRGWKDEAFSATPTAADNRETIYTYDPNDLNVITRVQENILGTTTSDTTFAYVVDPNNSLHLTVTRDADPNDLVTFTRFVGTDQDRPLKVIRPDGTADRYTYATGSYSASKGSPSAAAFTAGAGSYEQVTVQHGTSGSATGVANKSTKSVRVTDAIGKNVLSESYFWDGASYNRVGWTVTFYDDGRTDEVHHSNGTYRVYAYDDSCCDATSVVDESGIETTTTFDVLGRAETSRREGLAAKSINSVAYPATLDLDTETDFARDPNGTYVVTTTRTDGTLTLTSWTRRDMAGRTVASKSGGLKTTYVHAATGGGGGKVTATLPNGGTRITESWFDGRQKSTSGTAAIASYQTWDVNMDGSVTAMAFTGSTDTSSPRWSKTTTDKAGRVIESERPGYSTGGAVTVKTINTYNQIGQLVKVEVKEGGTPLRDPTVYEYNSIGQQVRSGLDRNNNNALDLASDDRISESDTSYVSYSGGYWLENTSTTYPTSSSGTAKILSKSRSRLTGFGASEISESESVDILGNITSTTTTLDRSEALTITATDSPTSDNDSEQHTRNGQLIRTEDAVGLVTSYAYDGLGRRKSVTDPRGNAVHTTYYTAGANTGRVKKVYRDPNAVVESYAEYTYGRPTVLVNDLGFKIYRGYDLFGRLTGEWGARINPKTFAYDATYGQRTEISTYRHTTGETGESWTPDPNDADTTTYAYHAGTGLLTTVTDAASNATDYEYTADGKIKKRKWARTISSSRIETTYDYDAETGELTKVDYSDDTPYVEYSYLRTGSIDTATTRTGVDPNKIVISYDYDYDTNLRLNEETVGDLFDHVLTHEFDGYGRRNAFLIGTVADPDAQMETEYFFDAKGRLNRFRDENDGEYGFVLSYDATSGFLDEVTYHINDANTINGQVEYDYDPYLSALTEVTNTWDDLNNVTPISRNKVKRDAFGRPDIVTYDGIPLYVTQWFAEYTFDSRNRLTAVDAYNGADPNVTTSPFTARDRDYGFDLANNRSTSAQGGGANSTYATNNLNQYLHINPPSGPNQVFTYDADRNLTSNGTWDFTYDAANRVTLIEPSTAPGSRDANDVKLEFKYDHLNRRGEKKVTAWDPNAVDWESTPTTHLKYGYDGDELVIEYNGLNSDSVERRYRWALGKLWWMRKLTGARYMMMRDVQDNVTMLVKRTGLAVEGVYEYDALGNVLSVAGAYGDENPMRWGSAYRDAETGFYVDGAALLDPTTSTAVGPVSSMLAAPGLNYCRRGDIYFDGCWGDSFAPPRGAPTDAPIPAGVDDDENQECTVAGGLVYCFPSTRWQDYVPNQARSQIWVASLQQNGITDWIIDQLLDNPPDNFRECESCTQPCRDATDDDGPPRGVTACSPNGEPCYCLCKNSGGSGPGGDAVKACIVAHESVHGHSVISGQAPCERDRPRPRPDSDDGDLGCAAAAVGIECARRSAETVCAGLRTQPQRCNCLIALKNYVDDTKCKAHEGASECTGGTQAECEARKNEAFRELAEKKRKCDNGPYFWPGRDRVPRRR